MARIPRRMISPRNRRQNTDKLSAKIQKYANLSVTLTKRRLTTYRRASELSTLTGADVAIITFSSSSNNYNNNNNNRFAFCFGSPDVHSVVDRYLNSGGDKPVADQGLLQRMILTKDLNEKSNLLEREYEYQQERARVLDLMVEERKGNNNKINNYWWDAPVETLDLGQLEELKTRLQDLLGQVDFLVNYNY